MANADTSERLNCVTLSAAATASNADLVPPWTRGFHCNVGGTVNAMLEGDTEARDFVVAAGAYYPYSLKRIVSLTTAVIIPLR